ncbi:MAG: type II toxin-antitoxin system VapC family toxin [Methanobacteriaceae archaeon]
MIFIDTSYIIAIIIEKDQWHSRVEEIDNKISKSEKVVSDLVITEAMATIGSLKGGKIAKTVYDYIKDNFTIHITDMSTLDAGMNTLLKYDGKLSLVDSTAVNIMNKLGIIEIVSFDSDYDKVKGIIRIQ